MLPNRKTAIENYIEQNQARIIQDIARLIAIPSDSEAQVPQALDMILTIAEELGLETHNENDLIGWAQIGTMPQDYLALITHIDVVPPGEGWNSDPFTLIKRDGWLIGRGIVDDKGAAVLSLYVLKFLKESGLPLRYPVRALFGTNEETSMRDVEYYMQHFPAPLFCFTPDADFPVCNGEKGHYRAQLAFPGGAEGQILALEGGLAANVIPQTAQATVRFSHPEWKASPGVQAVCRDGIAEITATGKSGHASLPEGTINAIQRLIDALLLNQVGNPEEQFCLQQLRQFHAATDGSSLGIAAQDGIFSPLTIVGGMISKVHNEIIQSVDSCFPTNITAEAITQALEKLIAAAGRVEVCTVDKPFYIQPDAPAIQLCLQAWNEISGENAPPFTMGGGTYARHFPCAISFGPQPPHLLRPDFAGYEHGANEALPEAALMQALQVYLTAMVKLQQNEL